VISASIAASRLSDGVACDSALRRTIRQMAWTARSLRHARVPYGVGEASSQWQQKFDSKARGRDLKRSTVAPSSSGSCFALGPNLR
jgi:hypothetical protein